MERSDARKRHAEHTTGLTDAERERIADNLRWHFDRHAAEPDKDFDSLGIGNAVLRVARIKAEAVQAERARIQREIEALLIGTGALRDAVRIVRGEGS